MEIQTSSPADTSEWARWASAIVRGFLGLLLAACLIQAARETVANWLGSRDSLGAIRSAERWDPSNPEFPAQFARALAAGRTDADPREIARAFNDATRLGPQRAENWAGLGEALDLAGDVPGATRAYERALELFPLSPEINWQFANFLIRSGDGRNALAPLRLAFAGDPSLRNGAFDLAWRSGIPRDQILQTLPARQEIFSAYLDYLDATGRIDAAGDAWDRLLASPEPINFDAASRYFDALIYAHRVGALAPVWAALARHDPDQVRWQPGGENRITNGGFEDAAANGGFGWRITPIEGAEVSFDTGIVHEGARSLFVHFDGKHNLDFSHVVQYVQAEANTEYRFIAYARSEELTTDQGPRIAIYDAFDRAALSLETSNLTGTSAWQEQKLEFRTGPKTQLLIVQIVRPPSRKIGNQIAGTLWLDDFSLIAIR